jgi:hypothetical protein
MEWWAWIAWGTSIAAGTGGLILGIRSEVRNRYQTHWTLELAPRKVTLHNRTGEDANNVGIRVDPHLWRVANYRAYSLVPANGEAYFAVTADGAEEHTPFQLELTWTRARTGRRYSRTSRTGV